MSDSKGKSIIRSTNSDKTVTVSGYTRKPPAMRGFDKVTIEEKVTRTTTYEKKARP
jgi:hypothetical protein